MYVTVEVDPVSFPAAHGIGTSQEGKFFSPWHLHSRPGEAM